MIDAGMMRLRAKLLLRRWECLRRMRGLEADWQALGQREPELEEEAQKADITSLYGRLDEQRMEELEEIDLALCRMAAGSYGLCESCHRLIADQRLEALPAARLCHGCARRFEQRKKRLSRAGAAIICEDLPSEYRAFTDEELSEAVAEHLRADDRLDLDELEVRCRRGVVYLEGAIPSESEHQIAMQILTDEMGLAAVVDHLQINELPWEREERTPPAAAAGLPEAAEKEPEEEAIAEGAPVRPVPERE